MLFTVRLPRRSLIFQLTMERKNGSNRGLYLEKELKREARLYQAEREKDKCFMRFSHS